MLFDRLLAAVLPWAWAHWWQLTLGLLGWITFMLLIAPRKPPLADKGSAQWASARAIEEKGLFGNDGIYLGRAYGRPIFAAPEQNVTVYGPPGTGKSAGTVFQTMRYWRHGVLAIDTNGLLARHTIHLRRGYGPVCVFDPLHPASDHYNPYTLVRWGTDYETGDVDAVVEHIVPPAPRNVRATDAGLYYARSAKAVLSAISLYLSRPSPDAVSLPAIRQYLASPGLSIRSLLTQMASVGHPVLTTRASLLLKERDDQLQGAWESAAQWLAPWDNPRLAANMRDTTIPWRQLQDPSEPLTLIIRISSADVKGWLRPVPRLMLDQILSQLMTGEPDPTRGTVLVLPDDTAALGFLSILESGPEEGRKYGLRFLEVFQSPLQVWREYGEFSSLFDTFGTWVIYRQNHPRSAQLIVDKLDAETRQEVVLNMGASTGGRASRSTSEHAYARDLLTKGELMTLPPHEVVICAEDLNIRATWDNAYLDPIFRMPTRQRG